MIKRLLVLFFCLFLDAVMAPTRASGKGRWLSPYDD
jgi:hypothetical protein